MDQGERRRFDLLRSEGAAVPFGAERNQSATAPLGSQPQEREKFGQIDQPVRFGALLGGHLATGVLAIQK